MAAPRFDCTVLFFEHFSKYQCRLYSYTVIHQDSAPDFGLQCCD